MRVMYRCLVACAVLVGGRGWAFADGPSGEAQAPPDLSAEEPRSDEFSLWRAANVMDVTAQHWMATRKCAACHTLPPYLMARPALNGLAPEPPAVRTFFETIIEKELEGEPNLPQDGVTAVFIQTAAALALHDRARGGPLHPLTRKQLDRMWTRQRADGGFEWPFRDTPPIKSDEHYGAVLAAIAAGSAPGYLPDKTANRGLERLRRFLKSQPLVSRHQKGMLLWAATRVEGLVTAEEQSRYRDDLAAVQRPDGGWSLASLTENPDEAGRQTDAGRAARSEPGHGQEFLVYVGRDKVYKSSLASDGYATGFAVFVLVQAAVPADDPRIQRGVAWLKQNQRQSGRWFTPSQSWHTQHYISNAGTAWAILALDACGEIRR